MHRGGASSLEEQEVLPNQCRRAGAGDSARLDVPVTEMAASANSSRATKYRLQHTAGKSVVVSAVLWLFERVLPFARVCSPGDAVCRGRVVTPSRLPPLW